MKPHKQLLLFFLLLWSVQLHAQKEKTFQAVYGGSYDDIGNDALETADGGYITVGLSASYGKGGYDLIISRMDSIGHKIWSKRYGGSSNEGEGPFGTSTGSAGITVTVISNIIQVDDSCYVICSTTKSTNSFSTGADAWLFKINKKGKVLWSRTYGGSKDDSGIRLIRKKGGHGFYVMGLTQSFVTSSSSSTDLGNIMIINTNDTGGVIWMKTYGSSEFDQTFSIQYTPDSVSLVLVGETFSSASTGQGDMLAMKIDTSGTLKWVYAYGGSSWDLAFNSIQYSKYSIYVYGQSQSYVSGTSSGGSELDIYMIKLDGNGKVTWGQNIGTSNREGGSPILYKNDSFYAAGFQYVTVNGSLKPSLFFSKMDTDLNVKVFRSYSPQSYWFNLHKNRIGGVSIFTSISNSSKDFYLLKMNVDGLTNNCNSTDQTTAVGVHSHTPTTTNLSSYFSSSTITTYKVNTFIDTSTITLDYQTFKCNPFVSWFVWNKACTSNPTQFYDSTWRGATSWSWNFGDASSSNNTSTLQNPTHTYKTAGTYTVKLIVKNGTNTDSVKRTVTVLSSPVAKITAPKYACIGDSITLKVIGGKSYVWSPSTAFKKTSDSVQRVKFTQASTYYVATTGNNGCPDLDTIIITTYPTPPAPTLTCASYSGDSAINLSWQAPSDTSGISYYVIKSTQPGSASFTYSDTVKNKLATSYTYSKNKSLISGQLSFLLYAVNRCGDKGKMSDTLKTQNLSYSHPDSRTSTLKGTVSKGTWYIELNTGTGYALYDTSIASSWQHTACYFSGTFRYYVKSSTGCKSYSNAVKVSYSDTAAPSRPHLDSVRVISCSQTKMYFSASSDKNVSEYIVYGSKNGGSFQRLDSFASGSASYSYVHKNINTTSDKWCYYVKAEKQCPSLLYSKASDTLCPLPVKPGEPKIIQLMRYYSWSGFYHYMEVDLSILNNNGKKGRAILLRSVNGGPWVTVDTITAETLYSTGTWMNATWYDKSSNYSDINNYAFKAVAIDSCGVLSSDTDYKYTPVLHAQVSNRQVKLTVTGFPMSGAHAYGVYRETSSTNAGTYIGSDSVLIDKNVKCGTTYTYYVVEDGLDSKTPARSRFYAFTNFVTVTATDSTIPDAPVLQYATVTSPSSNTIYSASSNDHRIAKYYIYGSKNGGAYKLIDSLTADTTKSSFSYLHKNISAKDQWCYYAKAVKICPAYHTSPSSDTACTVTFTAKAGNLRSYLSWTKYGKSSPARYIIQKLSGGVWKSIDSVSNATLSYSDTGLLCNQSYLYRVAARVKSGYTWLSYSDTMKVKVFDTVAPDVPYLKYASVTSASSNKIVFHASKDKDLKYYSIYGSKNGGAFSLLGTVSNTGDSVYTFLQTGITPAKDNWCYYIKATDTCAGNVSPPSSTHCVARLTATAGDYLNRTSWTSYSGFNVKDYTLEISDATRIIRRIILPASANTYTDSPLNCNLYRNYRLVVHNQSRPADSSYSNYSSATSFDTVKPDAPVLLAVNVLSSTSIQLSWTQSKATDVKEYHVFRKGKSGVYYQVAAVFNTGQYTDRNVSASDSSYCYKIQVVDSCAGNLSPMSIEHCTMLLKSQAKGCEQSLYLSWNAYSGWNDISKVEVYRTVNNSSEQLLTTLSGSSTAYKDTLLDYHKSYCYRLKAYEKSGSNISWSNSSCARTFFVDTPQVLYASKLNSSATAGQIVIKWKSQENKPHLSYYRLYSKKDNGSFSLLKDNIPIGQDSFIHTGANTREGEYYYYLIAMDSCGSKSDSSAVHKTMDLEVTVGQLIHNLSWTPYKGFKTLKYYLVQRKENGVFKTIDTLQANDTLNRRFPAPCNYTIHYRIAAVSSSGEVSYSDTMGRVAIDTVPANKATTHNVTILDQGHSQITFRGSDSLDVYAYTIQRAKDGVWGTAGQVLFTTPGDEYTYTDKVNTAREQLCYTVITLDSCLNATLSDTFCAVQLKGTAMNQGDLIDFTRFKGYPIGKYSVLYYHNNQWDTLTKITNKDTSYIHSPLTCNVPVSYKIAAEESGGARLTYSDTLTLVPFDTMPPAQVKAQYASVLNGKDIVLHWQKDLTDPDTKDYEISYRSKNGPWIITDTLRDKDSLHFTSLDPLDSIYYFRVAAIDSCARNKGKYSILHSPVQLDGKGENLSNLLSWKKYEGYNPRRYTVYRWNTKTNKWQYRDSVGGNKTSYLDTGLQCNIPYYYRIQAIDSFNLYSSYSDSISLTPYDTISPPRPSLVVATVNNGSSISLSWNRSVSDVRLYEVSVKTANGSWQVKDTVKDILSYTFTGLNTTDSTYSFRVMAIDSCAMNHSQKSYPHTVIQLDGKGQQLSNLLTWSAYKGFGVRQYTIYEWKAGWQKIDSVDGSKTSYIHQKLPCNVTRYYRVSGTDSSDTRVSYSDSIALTPFDTVPPAKPQFSYASVNPDQSIRLGWQWKTATDEKYFEVWRKQGASAFSRITTVVYDSAYTDRTVNPQANNYSYYVIAIDSCNTLNRSLASDTDKIMRIGLATGACKPEVRLSWNAYDNLPSGVSSYSVERSADKGASYKAVASLDKTVLSFTDTSVSEANVYAYRIKAIDNTSGQWAYSDTMSMRPWVFPLPGNAIANVATILKTGKTDGEISLSWQPYDSLADTFARGYRIWHSYSGKPGSWALLYDTHNLSTLSLTHKSINTLDSLHYYKVTVYNLCDKDGAPSSSHAPARLHLKNDNMLIILSWDSYKGAGVNRYTLYRSEAGKAYVPFVLTSDTAFRDTTVRCNLTYSYRVKTTLANGEESWSDSLTTVSFDTLPAKVPVPYYATIDTTDKTKGTITLLWQGNSKPSRSGYSIYRNAGTGYKLLVTTKDTSVRLISYTDTLDNTKGATGYYIKALDSCGNTSTASDTQTTVYLKAKAYSQYIQCSWTAYKGWKDGAQGYLVERRTPGAAWKLMKILDGTVLSYADSHVVCHVFYEYRIKAFNDSLHSYSNTSGDTAFELVAPAAPVINFARVVVSSRTTASVISLSWLPSTSPDAKYYHIYRSDDGGMSWTNIARNVTRTSRYYDAANLDVYSKRYTYEIETEDSCGNLSSRSLPHTTMVLTASRGIGQVNLSWTPYQGWTPAKYYIDRGNGAFIDSVPGTVTEYTDTNVTCKEKYFYRIVAQNPLSDSMNSWSNTSDTITIIAAKAPRPVHLERATVQLPNKTVLLRWTKSVSQGIGQYNIWRKDASTSAIHMIGTTSDTFYADNSEIKGSDCYFIETENLCGNLSSWSNPGCVIFLTGKAERNVNALSWNPYYDWGSGVKEYAVYRNTDSTGWQQVGTTTSPYYEDKDMTGDDVKDYCYKVEATENNTDASSYSTILCLHQEPLVFIPNVFTPVNRDGLNDTFMPKGSYIASYQMQVYNRWGEEVFSGSNKGWDGRFHNSELPEGIYVYIITIHSLNGSTQILKGNLTLLQGK